MVSFYNGVDPDNLPVNFYPYHGLDRLIEGLEYYYRTKDEIAPEVFFDIVGGGPAIEELKQLVASYRLQGYVIFHGYKDRQELEQLYGEASMAIGTLKLHLRGANIETAIKVSEALYQGIPVITSGETPFFSAVKQNIYQVKDDDSPISINEMLQFLGKKRIPVGDQVLLDLFSWEKIIEKIVNFGSEN